MSKETISRHITQHDEAVRVEGACPKCMRLGSDLNDVEVKEIG